MKYKVGDKVRVRQWDDMVEEFGTDEAGRINTKTGCRFTEEMKKFCGGVYEICSVLERNYLLKDGAKTIYWHFTDPMLEDVNLLSYTIDQLKFRVENASCLPDIKQLLDEQPTVKPLCVATINIKKEDIKEMIDQKFEQSVELNYDFIKKLLMEYFRIGVDCYSYNLTRDKSAFECGTVKVDDFEECN